MRLQIEESLLWDGLLCQPLGAKVNRRQEMMGCTGNLTIRQCLGFAEWAEIEDLRQVVLLLQTVQIGVCGIMQMGGTEKTVGLDGLAAGTDEAAKVTGVYYVIEKDGHGGID